MNSKTCFATVLVLALYLLFSLSFVLADGDSCHYVQESLGIDKMVEAMAEEIAAKIAAMLSFPESLMRVFSS